MKHIQNKKIVITGASRGLGKDLADFFVDKDCEVHGISRTAPEHTIPFNQHTVDITDYTSLTRTFYEIGTIDILILNAAVFINKSFDSTSIQEIENILDTNLKGTIYCAKTALPFIKNGGKIIFINSVAGLEEIENQSIYCASKYGLTAFAGILGKELRPRNIKVSSIHPGGLNTTLWNKNNPYPLGDVSKAMDTSAITELINHIIESKYDVDYKTIKVFPSIEWH